MREYEEQSNKTEKIVLEKNAPIIQICLKVTGNQHSGIGGLPGFNNNMAIPLFIY